MYQVQNQKIADFIMSDSRSFRFLMAFENGTTISENIASVNILSETPEDEIVAGAVISQSFTAELLGIDASLEGQRVMLFVYAVDLDPYKRATYADIEAYTYAQLEQMTWREIENISGLPYELIPMGKYFVTSCTFQGDLWNIEAHDGLYGIDEKYVSGLSFPATIQAVENEICNKLRIDGRFEKFEALFDKNGEEIFDVNGERLYVANKKLFIDFVPKDCTYRQMLSYCASLDDGKCILVNRNGLLEHRDYSVIDYEISSDRADLPKVAQRSIRITQINCIGADDENFEAIASPNDGRIMEFVNPYMTAEIFEIIKSKYLGFEYTPVELTYLLADPRLDMLDVVNVTAYEGYEYIFPIMSMQTSFDGGLMSTLASVGLSDDDQSAKRSDGPITRDVKQRLQDAMEQAEKAYQEQLQEAVDYINGANGGHVITKYNADGQPTEMYFTDNLDIEKASNIIRINNRGIAGTNGGMNGSYKTAITNDGRINASQILTGILSAIKLQSTNYSNESGSMINLATGEFSLGAGALTYNSETLNYVGNANITGGSFNVETADESNSLIKLSSNEWSIEISPLEWVLTNAKEKYKIVAQAGGVFFYKDNQETLVINSDGRIFGRGSNGLRIYTQGGNVDTAGGSISTEGGNIYMNDGEVNAGDVYVKVNGRQVSVAQFIADHS